MDSRLLYGVIENTGILKLRLEDNNYLFFPGFILGNNVTGPYIFKIQIEKDIKKDNLSPLCHCTGDLKDFIIDLVNLKTCKVNIYLYRLLYNIANEKLQLTNVDSQKVRKLYNKLCNISSSTDHGTLDKLLINNEYLKMILSTVSEKILKNSLNENEIIIHLLSKPQPTSKVPFEIFLNNSNNLFDNINYHSICVNVNYLNHEYSEPLKLSEILEKRKDFCLNYNLVFLPQTSCYAVNKLYDIRKEIIKISF